jgi:hypothetical protein
MPCEERDRLLDLFLEAAKAHSHAAHAIIGREGEALRRLTALAESSRKAYEDGYEALAARELFLGCTDNPETSLER